jgi:superfamily II DNA or RNA helicase
VLAVHAQWRPVGGGELLFWAEDSELPGAGPPLRGRPPAVPRRRPHPFAVSAEALAEALAGADSTLAVLADGAGANGEAVVWLPGTPTAPEASAQLIRDVTGAEDEPAQTTGPPGASGLWPFTVPVIRLGPDAAVDLLPALADHQSPELNPGTSVRALAAVAGLALEVVAGGRVLPCVVVDDGHYLARWTPLGGGSDKERVAMLAAALPPVCRALDLDSGRGGVPPGIAPGLVVRHALGACVDALCRDSLRRSKRSLLGTRSTASGRSSPPAERWLRALVAESAEVEGDPGELAKLERLVDEWRAGIVGRGGPWRLCFRLREPEAPEVPGGTETEEPKGPGESSTHRGRDAVRHGASSKEAAPHAEGEGGGTWRVELLLQATDDPSLVLEAGEVWRSPESIRRATRTLEAPHEVLLTELGRARGAYPELSAALREAAPTALELGLCDAHRFLSEVAPALEIAGFGVLLPSWWRRPSSRLGVRLRVSTPSQSGDGSGLLSEDGLCAFDFEAALGEERLTRAELKSLARLKAPLVRVRGRWVELRPDEVEKLTAFLVSGRSPGRRAMTVAEVLRAAAGMDQVAEGVPVLGVEADGVLGALLRGELEDHLDVRDTPPGFSGELRPYQRRAVAWMELLERAGLGACLADDMGLGKTAMVLGLVQAEHAAARSRRSRRRPGPTLVVCPTSVVGNWQREAERFTPALSVHVHHGATRARSDTFTSQVKGADIVVTSYSLVDRDRAALSGVRWGRVVLDEAQNVKNPEAKQTKAVRAIQAPRRLALTGTPVENHLGELWSIMEVLNPSLLGSPKAFRERFAVPIERYHEEDAADRLRTLTRPFILRRLKTDRSIIDDLPEKLEMKVLCNLTREQATLYQAVVEEMLLRIEGSEGIERRGLVLAAMLRLKQVCNHPAHYLGDGSSLAGRSGKLERTVEVLEEVLEVGERALVFTQYAEMGAMLRSHLQQRLGCQVAFLHGGVPRRQRDAMVHEFQDEEGDVSVMVLSLKAGGTGLNLTAANHVVHFDRWWNPAVENQATDRAFRIGQRRDVQVRKLVCVGTLEDRIDQMIEAKRQLAERIVGAGEDWLTELSTEELAEVFRLSSRALGAA